MRDLENYECEGQMDLEDYLSMLEKEHRGIHVKISTIQM